MRLAVQLTKRPFSSIRCVRSFLPISVAAFAVFVSTAASGAQPREASTAATLNDPPEILSFTVQEGIGNFWIFRGRVSDENPGTCIVIFGGLLEGSSVEVDEDGTFIYIQELPEGTTGGVTAQAIDEEGLESNVAEGYVG